MHFTYLVILWVSNSLLLRFRFYFFYLIELLNKIKCLGNICHGRKCSSTKFNANRFQSNYIHGKYCFTNTSNVHEKLFNLKKLDSKQLYSNKYNFSCCKYMTCMIGNLQHFICKSGRNNNFLDLFSALSKHSPVICQYLSETQYEKTS